MPNKKEQSAVRGRKTNKQEQLEDFTNSVAPRESINQDIRVKDIPIGTNTKNQFR